MGPIEESGLDPFTFRKALSSEEQRARRAEEALEARVDPFFASINNSHVQWDGGVYEGKLYNVVYQYICIYNVVQC